MIIYPLIQIHLFTEGAIKLNQPAIKKSPPRGVIGPKKLKFKPISESITSRYILPEKRRIPIDHNHTVNGRYG